jgi:hypothetical protein
VVHSVGRLVAVPVPALSTRWSEPVGCDTFPWASAGTACWAGQDSRGQDLMDEARDVMGSAGVRLVLAVLKVGRIPARHAP